MNIVILGCGTIGSYIASILATEEHDIFIIDKSEHKLRKIATKLDVSTVCASLSDWRILEELVECNPDFFLAMTDDDEKNLSACSIAKNLGYPCTICRIGDVSYLNKSRLDFGRIFFVDHFLAVNDIVAYDMLKSMVASFDCIKEEFSHGAIQMRNVTLPDNFALEKRPLAQWVLPKDVIFALIQRFDKESDEYEVIFPHGDTNLAKHDSVTLIGSLRGIKETYTLLEIDDHTPQDVMVVGGGVIGISLAKILVQNGINVKIIEKKKERCDLIAAKIPEAVVIHHEVKDSHIFLSEGIEKCAVAVATADDNTNLLLSALAKEVGALSVVSIISDISLIPIFKKLAIDYVISEQIKISNKILALVYAKNVITVKSIAGNAACVIEVKASGKSKLIGIPLHDLQSYLPKDMLVCLVENKGHMFVAKGSQIISEGDKVILITSPKNVSKVEALF